MNKLNVDLLLQLRTLFEGGNGNSAEADVVRDQLTEALCDMTEEERRSCDHLSVVIQESGAETLRKILAWLEALPAGEKYTNVTYVGDNIQMSGRYPLWTCAPRGAEERAYHLTAIWPSEGPRLEGISLLWTETAAEWLYPLLNERGVQFNDSWYAIGSEEWRGSLGMYFL